MPESWLEHLSSLLLCMRVANAYAFLNNVEYPERRTISSVLNPYNTHARLILKYFSLTVKVTTLISISGRGSAISSA